MKAMKLYKDEVDPNFKKQTFRDFIKDPFKKDVN